MPYALLQSRGGYRDTPDCDDEDYDGLTYEDYMDHYCDDEWYEYDREEE